MPGLRTLTLTFLSCLLPLGGLASERPLLDLAAELRGLQRYDACAVEALRHGFLHPDDRPLALQRAAVCLTLAGRPAQAVRLLQDPRARQPDGKLPASAVFHLCQAAVQLGDLPLPSDCTDVGAQDPYLRRAAHAPVQRALWQGDLPAAERALKAEPESQDPLLQAWRAQTRTWIDLHRALPRPSPWLAGTLSALVPGAGRLYLGHWQDGLVSLAMVGAPAYFAWDGFHSDGVDSVRGWLLGTVAGVLYLGNVYGSAVGAEVEARRVEQAWQAEVRDALRRRHDLD